MKTYGPTMQCNSKTLAYVKCSKCPPLVITHALSLNYHLNRLINDRLYVNHTLPQLINISRRMLTDPLLYHCQDSVINRTKDGYVKKLQVWCYDEVWRLVTKQFDRCAHTPCWRAVLLKLKPLSTL